MDSKVCVVCNTEKSIDNLYNKYRECKPCKIQRTMKRYYDNEDKLSNQRRLYYEKNREVLPARCKINQQNRKYHTQQLKDLNNKVEQLTQAMETLILKFG